jgi:hypothetical protein
MVSFAAVPLCATFFNQGPNCVVKITLVEEFLTVCFQEFKNIAFRISLKMLYSELSSMSTILFLLYLEPSLKKS